MTALLHALGWAGAIAGAVMLYGLLASWVPTGSHSRETRDRWP